MAGSRRENRLEVLQHGVRRSAHAAATIWLAESCCHPLPLQGSWRPELCACACLNQANNSLSGPAFPPAWLRPGAMPDLATLVLSGNAGLAGTLPADLAWPNLKTL